MSTATKAKSIKGGSKKKSDYTKQDARMAKIASKVVESKLDETVETKFHINKLLSVNVDTTGSIYQLSSIPIGTGDESRLGDQVTAKSLRFNYRVTVGDTHNLVRVALFQFTDSNANGNPTIGNCLQDVLYPDISPWTHDNIRSKRIKVLYDRVHFVNADREVEVAYVNVNKGFTRNIHYENGSTTNGKNQIYALVISDSGVTPHPQFSLYNKLQFTDQ